MTASADPRVAVIVVSWNAHDDVVTCLRSLQTVTQPLETVVVDNASEDGSSAAVRQGFPGVRVIDAGSNLGFGRASNLGWRATRAPYVLFLNPDAEVAPGAVESLGAVLDARPDVGIVGPATRYADGRPQVSFGFDLTPLGEWRQQRLMRAVRARDATTLSSLEAAISNEHEPAWVSASCLLTRRLLLETLAGFDERFFLYEEDVDLCLRARLAGFRVVFAPSARVTHRLGRSMERSSGRARLEYDRSHLYFYRKHRGQLATAALRAYLGLTGLAGLVRGGTDDDRKAARARLELGWRGLG